MDYTQIISAVIALISALVSAFLIPWIKTKIDADKLQTIRAYVEIGVKAAEQLYVSPQELSRLLQNLEGELESLRGRLADNQARSAQAEKAVAEQEALAAGLRAQAEEALSGQSELLAKSSALAEDITAQKSAIAALEAQKEATLARAADLRQLAESLTGDRAQKEEVLQSYQRNIDAAQADILRRQETQMALAAQAEEFRRRLTDLNREKLEQEYKELEEKISYFKGLLADPALIRGVLKDELTALRDKYGDKRYTEIQDVADEIDVEDLIEEEQCVFTLTHGGYIKRLPVSEYRSQGRGGKGIRAMATKEEDYVETVFTASTHDYILFFTSKGRVFIKKGYTIPEAGRNARGTNIVNLIQIETGENPEKVSAMIRGRGMEEDSYLVFVTRKGTVKRMQQSALKNIRSNGIRALTLEEGDELISVIPTTGDEDIIIATYNGMAASFNERDVRPMGRSAVGVRGIRLREGDFVVGAGSSSAGEHLLTITEKGYGKRTPIGEYTVRGRGSLGIKNYNVTEKTGKIADVKMVSPGDDILVISDDATIIRMAVDSISVLGRSTQGVRIMRLSEGARVISVALTDRAESEDAATAEEPEA